MAATSTGGAHNGYWEDPLWNNGVPGSGGAVLLPALACPYNEELSSLHFSNSDR